MMGVRTVLVGLFPTYGQVSAASSAAARKLASFGLVMVTGSFYLVQQLPPQELESWVGDPPLLNSILVVTRLYVRIKTEDSPAPSS